LLHAGDFSFNDVQPWRYHRLPEVLGGGTGYEVRTEGQFDEALRSAWADSHQMSLIHAHLGQDDFSDALHRLARRLSARV
jgi:indolepyruvate decarboxylase